MQQLAAYKAKVERLEKTINDERVALLRRLHTDTGFASREELIAALRGIGGGGRRGPKPGGSTTKGGRKRKKRAKITPELRDQIIAAVKAGGTGNAVASKFGVSLPTVQNIKRDAGLTSKRRKK
jgi:DNA invertase Pin-like site-specific DNA recombinase